MCIRKSMKKLEELIQNLAHYSHVKQHNIHELLDYIEGTSTLQQQKKMEALLMVNRNLGQIIEGIQIYYSLYGKDSQKLMHYLQQAREEGYAIIKGQME